jgi:microsomal dipeptidase-like Zn-dependent dipeptidase
MSGAPPRLQWLAGLGLIVSAGYACTIDLVQPTPGTPSATVTVEGSLSPDAVWGVADLHAHPAAHLAFGGLDGAGLIWGDPGLPGGALTAIPGGNLPDILACDPETHAFDVTDEVSRTTRAKVFGLLTQTTNFPHVAHGGQASDGEVLYESWPNGRDILHESMNIQSLRRAYEGGLRLIFAATVDSQPIGLAMHTTIFPAPFQPSRQAERASAEAQLIFIRNVVNENADWMEVAATPEQAENAIENNRLAVVLALENDGLLLEDVQYLVKTYGVASIVPIHLIDNDVGGTAAYNDVFNAGTALMGQMFGYPGRFISVEADPTLRAHLGWPDHLAITGPNFDVSPVDYPTYAALGYSQHPLCSPQGDGVAGESGTRNSVGLREPQTISALMALGMMVDVAHMGFRSTQETVQLAQSSCNYPLLDTHTSFHFRDENGGDERALAEDHADYVAVSGGVVGQGITGRTSERTCDPLAGGSDTVASARGGPLVKFESRDTTSVVVKLPQGGRACTPSLPANATQIGLRPLMNGSIPGGSTAYAQIGFDGGHQQQVELTPNVVTPVPLDNGLAASAIGGIDIGVLDRGSCSGGSASVQLTGLEISAADGSVLFTIDRGQLGVPDNDSLDIIATLGSGHQSVTVYARCPAANASLCDPAEPFVKTPASNQPIEHLRVRVHSGTKDLRGDSGLIVGARVVGALCVNDDCHEVPDACSNPMFTMTPEGGWPNGTEIDQYVSFPRPAPRAFVAVKLCLGEQNLTFEPWEVDEVDVDVVVDPMRLWTGDYGRTLERVFCNRPGALALGTDANGLSPQLPFTDFVPSYVDDDEGCGTTTSLSVPGEAQYGDDASGGTFRLHRPQQIGTIPLCVASRGVANYGMLPEFFAAVYHYSPDVYRSLFQSARATIAAWKAARTAAQAFATTPGTCSLSDAGAPAALACDAGSDVTGDSTGDP